MRLAEDQSTGHEESELNEKYEEDGFQCCG